jgi:hypothetical protein
MNNYFKNSSNYKFYYIQMSRYDKCFTPAKVLMKFKCAGKKKKGRPLRHPYPTL